MTVLTAVEMFQEMVRRGYVVPARTEPSRLREPTAYVSVPTSLVFSTPPIRAPGSEGKTGAKLESRSKGNPKRKRRAKR
jgi:hypothetical protein